MRLLSARGACALACAPLLGCGAGAPLLHPAHVLGAGDVRASAGVSAQAIAGDVSKSLRDAQAIDTAKGDTTGSSYARGAMALAALSPGIAPVIAARVGLGEQFEGGLTYTGRGARIDARRAFKLGGAWVLSIGAGLDATIAGGSTSTRLDAVHTSDLRAFGFDVPALVGYRSTGGLYQLWLGARGGYSHYFIAPVRTEPRPMDVTSLDVDQAHVGGVLGVATGFRHVHVALEIGAAFQILSGTFLGTKASVEGLSLTPASSFWWDFQ